MALAANERITLEQKSLVSLPEGGSGIGLRWARCFCPYWQQAGGDGSGHRSPGVPRPYGQAQLANSKQMETPQWGCSCVVPSLSELWASRTREKMMGKVGIKTDEREGVGRGQQESGLLRGFRPPELLKSRPGLRGSPTFWSTRPPSSYWRLQHETLFRVICSHWRKGPGAPSAFLREP